ncbi:hypothetical protein IWZ00DRAFT_43937 [Phyllosticta capitalensis]|uniref:TPR-like protein n=1 Tax=Phyllosticta capitalensis TaxID=121624 RepID=A0ABR1Z4V1_9PEZI
MASHQQPSPTAGTPAHHPPPPGHAQPNGHAPMQTTPKSVTGVLQSANETTWLALGGLSEMMNDYEGAKQCYDHALRHNNWSVPAMQAISSILRSLEQFPAAVEYLRNIIKIDANNGEVWSSLGHCYLMMDDLQQAYSAYQQALYHLTDPKEPKLWYGIGILYDRYGSLEHAEEAFSQVMRMDPNFEKANEIYFRLGIIYKQQQKFTSSLECFKYIVNDPPRPLTEEDIWFQIGHVHEQQKDYESAKMAYKRVLERDQNHAKVLQQLGWLYHQASGSFSSQEQAIEFLEKSVNADNSDAQSWYLLGRCYMSQQKYPKAYEAYQQAVYRDGRNPTFWCSIGVLYYQINQYRDALDAYSRAIRLNPNISEVWYDLGTLYESCNNQTADALDAYQRAADLDPTNVHIRARLQLLQNGQPTNGMPNQNSTPLPQDVHPQAYQPGAMNGPPQPQWSGPQPSQPAPQQPLPPTMGGNDWARNRLAGIQDPQMPPQQLTPFEQRDAALRPQQHPPPPNARPGSPRQELRAQEQLRVQYQQEPPRLTAPGPPGRRGLSPSPKSHNAAPSLYQGPGSLPPQQVPPPSQLAQSQPPAQPNRIANPNYGTHASNGPPAPPTLNGPPPPGPGPLPPYGRPTSPPPEVRPLLGASAPSPNSRFHPPGYPAHGEAPGGIAGGAPPPASALAAAEAAARDRDDRPPSAAPKRLREWEDEASASKPPTNDEKRQRLEETPPRRPSPPERMASQMSQIHRTPPEQADARRPEEQRHINDGYHPSEAAHHPPSLPAIPPPPPPHTPHLPEIKEERKEQHEPAARKMEVDEDYDDSGDDEKARAHPHAGPPRSERNSPRSASVVNGVQQSHAAGTPLETKAM